MNRFARAVCYSLAAVGSLWMGGCAGPGSHVSVLPRPMVQAAPNYPFEMRRAGISGQVTVECIVDTAGVPRDLTIVKSTNKSFEQPALQAVAKWRFHPGTIDGRPVNCRMSVPLDFSLEEGNPSAPKVP